MSRSHANRGDPFQQLLDLVHAGYMRQGRALVTRNPPPMKILRAIKGKPGQFVCCFESEGPPDYSAQSGPYAFLFDAKDCADTRWPFDHLPAHQAHRFDAHEAQDPHAVAGVVLRMSGAVWWLPWVAVGPLWWEHAGKVGRAARGTASLSVADCDRVGRRAVGADWLSAALRGVA